MQTGEKADVLAERFDGTLLTRKCRLIRIGRGMFIGKRGAYPRKSLTSAGRVVVLIIRLAQN